MIKKAKLGANAMLGASLAAAKAAAEYHKHLFHDYIAHLAGPKWYLAPLIFPIEVISTCIRPVTLSIRLMVNMAVDHLVGSIFLGLVAVLLPIPLAFLALIIVAVQTLVFCLLTSIYIGLATEKHDHGEHAEHGAGHGHPAAAH